MTIPVDPARFDQEARKRAVGSVRHPLARMLLTLTFTTGLVDAASYLGLGRVFTANMTGNIVLLGFGIAGSVGLPVLAPLVSLGSFLAGAGAGGVLATRMGDRHPQHVAHALAIEVSLIAIAAVFAASIAVRPDGLSGDIVVDRRGSGDARRGAGRSAAAENEPRSSAVCGGRARALHLGYLRADRAPGLSG